MSKFSKFLKFQNIFSRRPSRIFWYIFLKSALESPRDTSFFTSINSQIKYRGIICILTSDHWKPGKHQPYAYLKKTPLYGDLPKCLEMNSSKISDPSSQVYSRVFSNISPEGANCNCVKIKAWVRVWSESVQIPRAHKHRDLGSSVNLHGWCAEW